MVTNDIDFDISNFILPIPVTPILLIVQKSENIYF